MSRFEELISGIRPSDKVAAKRCERRFDSCAKPLKGLGDLESYTARLAAVFGTEDFSLDRRRVYVFCADNGVVEEGVAQSDSSITQVIAGSVMRGTASVCRMAETVHADVIPVDVGMNAEVQGVRTEKRQRGTGNIAKGPAMSRETAEATMLFGAALMQEAKDEGINIVVLGEGGIGNTTTAAAICSALLSMDPALTAGRGAGLSTEGLRRKTEVIRRAIQVNAPNPEDPVEVLQKLGGLDIAAMTGAFLGAAACHLPVVMDGVIAAAAALAACRIAPDTRDYILPSHMSSEPAMQRICEELDFSPPIRAGMHLGEGTGGVLLLPLLDAALAVYRSAASFSELSMEQYEVLS